MTTSAKKAYDRITAQLQGGMATIHSLRLIDLPILENGGAVYGPANNGSGNYVTYPAGWTGLAIHHAAGKANYWFLGRCDRTGERQFYCLGSAATTTTELIALALEAVGSDIEFWANRAA